MDRIQLNELVYRLFCEVEGNHVTVEREDVLGTPDRDRFCNGSVVSGV